MNDLLDAISERVKTPYYGYFLIAFLSFNWREIFFLIVSDDEVLKRIEYFDNGTSFSDLIGWPVIIGFGLWVSSYWLKWLSEYLISYPARQISHRTLKLESELTVERTRLEQRRNKFSNVEGEAIVEQAKRIDELKDLEDPVTREHAKIGIEELRLNRLPPIPPPGTNPERIRGLMRIAQSNRTLAEASRQQEKYDESAKYLHDALETEKRLMNELPPGADKSNSDRILSLKRMGETYRGLAEISRQQKKYDDSKMYSEQALDIEKRLI